MKLTTMRFLLLMAITACSNHRESLLPGSPSAFIGSLIGRWTTGCTATPNGGYQKFDILFTETSGVSLEQSYKDKACTQISYQANAPKTFTYTIKPKPEPGRAILNLSGSTQQEPMEAILFDNSLSITVLGTSINFTRVPGRN